MCKYFDICIFERNPKYWLDARAFSDFIAFFILISAAIIISEKKLERDDETKRKEINSSSNFQQKFYLGTEDRLEEDEPINNMQLNQT